MARKTGGCPDGTIPDLHPRGNLHNYQVRSGWSYAAGRYMFCFTINMTSQTASRSSTISCDELNRGKTTANSQAETDKEHYRKNFFHTFTSSLFYSTFTINY